jgi:hypothetical protein
MSSAVCNEINVCRPRTRVDAGGQGHRCHGVQQRFDRRIKLIERHRYPSTEQIMLDFELIEHFANGLIHKIQDGLGAVVERRCWWKMTRAANRS